MELKIELKNPKYCDGCPCWSYGRFVEGFLCYKNMR